ncbi:uncharacterized protein LOC142980705 [Anticarsia gemmatalis]|uniref:uncharacterized protein LOC142980705 n=1 Tax=Anticarsia gemmatalis TaxID=129554 RepID=UPI003F76885F
MCQCAIVLTTVLFIAHTNGESSEDQAFTYYAPSTVNFHDIYANSLAMLADDPSPATPLTDDDSYHLSNMPSHFVEYQPRIQSTVGPPPTPRYAINSSYIRNGTEETTLPTSSTSSTTEEPDELIIKVLPIAKSNKYQRGVLDLLFPPARVKTFKSVFDTIRRLLSHTF